MNASLPTSLRYLAGTDNRRLDMVVVVAVARCEWHLAMKLLAWMDSLSDSPHLIVYCAPLLTKPERDALGAVTPCTVVHAQFVDTGYFGGANNMFKGALDYCEKNHPGKAMLWIEADCVLMRSGWFDAILDEYRGCGQPFMGDVHLCAINHMTGNAVWHPDWRNIAPSLALLPGPDPEWGWDSMCWEDTFTRCHRANTIQQIWRPPLPITAAWADKNIGSSTMLFHQVKDGSLIDVLTDRMGIPRIPLLPALEESSYSKGRQKPVDPVLNAKLTPAAKFIAGMSVAAPAASPAVVVPAPPIIPKAVAIGSVSILIVTYAKDMEFLRHLLKSIAINAHGFHEVVVAVPEHERGQYDWVRRARIHYYEDVTDKGMLKHMAMKCRADEICPQAQYIWHLDADCIVWSHVKPTDLFKNGKPVLVRERYADLRNANRRVWQKCVEESVGWKPEYETMVRQGALHERGVYSSVRAMVEKHTCTEFDEHVVSGQNAFPQSFAEFPLLGAVAIRDFRNRYEMVDYDWQRDAKECGVPKDTQFQYIYRRGRDPIAECWSHGGIARYKSDIEAWLRGQVPAYFIK